MDTNKSVRRMAKANGVPFWKISEKLGISEPTFTRLMRKPLNTEKESEIKKIIKKFSQDERSE